MNDIRRWCAVTIVAACGGLAAEQSASAAKVLEFDFITKTVAAVQSPAVDGEGINTMLADFHPNNILNDIGGTGQGQSLSGPFENHAKYVIGGNVPNDPVPLPPNWDDAAVRFNGRQYARYTDASLGFTSDFSAFVRFNRAGNAQLSDLIDYIAGGSQPNNNGWGIYLDLNGGNGPLLDVNLGGELKTPMTQRGVFNGAGPAIANNTWYDVGIVYTGTVNDGIDDTLKVFLNGALINTFFGDAGFDPIVGGLSFAIGADSFGNEAFNGHLDRVVLWNNAISDEAMRAESVPEPSSVALALCGLAALAVAGVRRKIGKH